MMLQTSVMIFFCLWIAVFLISSLCMERTACRHRKLVSCNDFTVIWEKYFHSLNFQIHFDYFEGTEKLFLSATILIKLLIIKLGTCKNFWWDSQSSWRRARLPRWREGESVGGRSRGRRDRDCSSGPRESRTTTRENNLHIFLVHWINFDLITKIDIWILSDWLVKIFIEYLKPSNCFLTFRTYFCHSFGSPQAVWGPRSNNARFLQSERGLNQQCSLRREKINC